MKLHKDLKGIVQAVQDFVTLRFPSASSCLVLIPRIVGFMNVCCCCLVLEFVSSSTMLSSALQLMSKLCLKCFVKTSGKLCHCQVSRTRIFVKITQQKKKFEFTSHLHFFFNVYHDFKPGYVFVRLCCFSF